MAETNLEQLKLVLDELFMFDRADLDFGLYRVMNVKREEIRAFLDTRLLPLVREALGERLAGEQAALRAQIEAKEQELRADGQDPAASVALRELRGRYDAIPDIETSEAEVYAHLTSFFRRYYKEGDFISLRRYKEGVYAIPYEGEEVKLHWANADQYYIKTTEQFRNYTFLLPDGRRVHFKLVEADTERNNNRAQAGNDRRFVLTGEGDEDGTALADATVEVDGELLVRFEYRPDTAGRSQKALDALTVATVTDAPAAKAWVASLSAPAREDSATGVLAKHVAAYTARNTFDYFIHKDLGGFLRRELDFYLKNEVLHLDDIDTAMSDGGTLERHLRTLKAIRRVATPIIEFLASLEEFQKRLWLKQKFVVETHWCVTLDRVPRDLYAEVAANVRQREAWVSLFAIDGIARDITGTGYSMPLTNEFLAANPYLVLDTSFFDAAFTERLLASIDDLDATTDGLLVQSENFQALNLMQARYRNEVSAVYSDPPYNTGDGDFPYKDSYQSSSWLSMSADRLALALTFLTPEGSFVSHIDEHEYRSLEYLLDQAFGRSGNIGPIVWDKRNPKGDARGIAAQHEYLCWAVKDGASLGSDLLQLHRPKENAQAILDRAAAFIAKHGGVPQARGEFREWLKAQPFSGGELAYNQIDDVGEVFRPVSMAWPNKNRAPDQYFLPLTHPRTGRSCPVPARGWRNPPETMKRLLDAGLILFGADETTQPTRKYLLRENMTENVPSLYYFGGSDDDLQASMGFSFPNPKPVRLGEYVVSVAVGAGGIVLDHFAGSGTTGHATINLNRKAVDHHRKYILVEMGDYFGTVLKPRVLKAVYSMDWKDGKPVSREGVSQLIKVIRLESYEDTLNNLHVRPQTERQERLLAEGGRAHKEFRDEYALRYWVEQETRGSASLLNIAQFDDPWGYHLDVSQGSAAETQPVTVDLVETFNYLLGLRVQQVDRVAHVLKVVGMLPPSAGHPAGEKSLVLWRNTHEVDAKALDEFLEKQRINSRDLEYDVIYVNGDNHIENTRRSDETWKVRLIEDEFQRLMFETAEQERR